MGDSRVGFLYAPGIQGNHAFSWLLHPDSLDFGIDQFRIPPKELAEMQPQQSLMLRVAAEAIGDARWDAAGGASDRRAHRHRAGFEYDELSSPLAAARPGQGSWNDALGVELSDDELTLARIDDLEAVGGAGPGRPTERWGRLAV